MICHPGIVQGLLSPYLLLELPIARVLTLILSLLDGVMEVCTPIAMPWE